MMRRHKSNPGNSDATGLPASSTGGHPSATGGWRILRLDGGHERLFHAPHLGEFDAVIFDDRADSVVEGFQELLPGRELLVPEQTVTEVEIHLRRRTSEALDLLGHGGILVVRLRATSGLTCQSRDGFSIYSERVSVRFSDWWLPTVPRLETLRQVPIEVITAANGARIRVEAPDHCLEPYLMTAEYAATVAPLVFADRTSPPLTLATNAVGNVVACESKLGSGTVLMVPADGDQDLLERCVNDLLTVRQSVTSTWKVREEAAIIDRFRETTEQLRRERERLLLELTKVLERKAPIMEDPDVRRILDRFRNATAESTSAKDTLNLLHRLIEIVEDRLGGEADLIATLGISKGTVNAIKHPANDKRLDVRHATVGEPEVLESSTVAKAIAAGQLIVQAFIEHLYENSKLPDRA